MLENLFKKKKLMSENEVLNQVENNIPSIEPLFKNGISNSTSCTPSNEHGSLSRT